MTRKPPRMNAAVAPPEVVAIAGSAGGLPALLTILSGLPASFPCPILVMLHQEPHHPSMLVDILGRHTRLTVREAEEGAIPEAGSVYVAPPDRHLTLSADHRVHLTQEPPVHWVRPSADVLFRSIAQVYGPRGVGVLCSGTGTDGAAGLRELHESGGRTLVQDRATSPHFGMPGEAIRLHAATAVLPLSGIAPALLELVAAGDADSEPGPEQEGESGGHRADLPEFS